MNAKKRESFTAVVVVLPSGDLRRHETINMAVGGWRDSTRRLRSRYFQDGGALKWEVISAAGRVRERFMIYL